MNEPAQYTKRAVTIAAMQWDGSALAATDIIKWALANGGTIRYNDARSEAITPYRPGDLNVIEHPAYLAIDTLEGTMRCSPTDWVIRGVKGEFYACRDDIFHESYIREQGAPPP